MKKHLVKIFLLITILNISQISQTNSYFSFGLAIDKNTISANCWVAPNVPVLNYPLNNSFADSIWNNNPHMDWDESVSSCPISGIITYQYESSYDFSFTQIAYQSGWLTNSFIPAPSTPNATYYWRVRAKDSFGNISEFSNPWKFIVDQIVPSSIITKPCNSDNDHDVIFPIVWFWDGKIEGTATDNSSGSGISHVDLFISRQIVDRHWNGSAWVEGTIDELANRVRAVGTTNWSYQVDPLYIPFGKFKIVAHAVDNAGNTENSATIEFENAQTPTTDINLSSNHSTNKINFEVTNINSPLNYEILYTANGLEKGISGKISSNEIINSKYSKDFYLGTCSSGGNCTPEFVEIGSTITINLTGEKTITKTFRF